ncbi:hypothetical protein FTX61_19385 [Nitriliruptoraceae bacterium ZYF776]|nr:hypothetical protein [Profundirhabdus halotolerans]
MAPITLDPDDVNQDHEVTLTDGRIVVLAEADTATLRRVARQLHTHRSTYEAAFAPADDDLATGVATGAVALADVAPLHRRVTELLEDARRVGGRAAAQLELPILLQRRTWTSSAGVTEPLEELTPSHRHNLVAWLDRHSDELEARAVAELSAAERARVAPADPWVAGTPLHRRLRQLIAGETGTERARDQARQVVRGIEFERRGRWPDR